MVGGVFKQRIYEGISLPTLMIFLVYIYTLLVVIIICITFLNMLPLIFFSHNAVNVGEC